MKYFSRLIFIFVALIAASNAYSRDEPVKFENPNHEQRYQVLLEEIRCLVCQNQSLADSNADLAQDLRKEIYVMIIDGKQDEQILQFMVERYGDFVLYRPPLSENTWLLWFGPFLILLIGITAAVIIIRKQSGLNSIAADISEEQKQRLTELLNKDLTGNKE